MKLAVLVVTSFFVFEASQSDFWKYRIQHFFFLDLLLSSGYLKKGWLCLVFYSPLAFI